MFYSNIAPSVARHIANKKDEIMAISSFLLSLVYFIPLISSKTGIFVLPEMRGVMEI